MAVESGSDLSDKIGAIEENVSADKYVLSVAQH